MRFVSPETVRIDLQDGPNGEKNWIVIKKELSAGEDKKFRAAGLRKLSQRPDPDGKMDPKTGSATTQNEVDVDWQTMALARVEAYLLDWSATNEKGHVKVTRQAIEDLEKADFDEIDDAIQAHMAAVAEEKKAPSGPPTSIPASA